MGLIAQVTSNDAVLRTLLAAVSVKKLAAAVIRTCGRQGSNCTSLMTTCNYCLDNVQLLIRD